MQRASFAQINWELFVTVFESQTKESVKNKQKLTIK
jgi:hypothetical protein